MICDTQWLRVKEPTERERIKANQVAAVARLEKALSAGAVTLKIGPQGAITFQGWKDRSGVSDVCAYRKLGNSPVLRRAVARAEVTAGRKVNTQAIGAGIHSHDGGMTWHPGH